MTAKADALIQLLETSLTPLGAFRSRAMFGGRGLYLDDVFFGLIAYDKFYLKTDDRNRGDYIKAKSKPFSFESGRKGLVITSYWECPAKALKDARELRRWIEIALEAARCKKTQRPAHRSRKARTRTP
jgi:DNA transformation protein